MTDRQTTNHGRGGADQEDQGQQQCDVAKCLLWHTRSGKLCNQKVLVLLQQPGFAPAEEVDSEHCEVTDPFPEKKQEFGQSNVGLVSSVCTAPEP